MNGPQSAPLMNESPSTATWLRGQPQSVPARGGERAPGEGRRRRPGGRVVLSPSDSGPKGLQPSCPCPLAAGLARPPRGSEDAGHPQPSPAPRPGPPVSHGSPCHSRGVGTVENAIASQQSTPNKGQGNRKRPAQLQGSGWPSREWQDTDLGAGRVLEHSLLPSQIPSWEDWHTPLFFRLE